MERWYERFRAELWVIILALGALFIVLYGVWR